MTSTDALRDAFVERLFQSAVATMDVFTVHLGDRLGLYRALAEAGPLTPGELAERAGINARYAREWLEQQAASGIIEVDDASAEASARRFTLPPAHAEALVDPESPYAMAATCRSLAAIGGVLPKLVDAYRTGGGVLIEAVDAIEAQGDFNRPWLVGSFATEYLPKVPDVHAKLRAGARVADIACGVGWAAIAIAREYPADERGRVRPGRAVDRAGPGERPCGGPGGPRDVRGPRRRRPVPGGPVRPRRDRRGPARHVHPVEVLSTIRGLLAPGGTLIVADERVADAFHAPANETERLFYGYSVLDCLPAGMMDQPSAETGTVMRRSTLERYASEAGFAQVSVLPIEHDFLRFYRLDP